MSALFLTIFERTYDNLHIFYFLWLQHVSIKSNNRRSNFAIAPSKKSPKKPNQKMGKCCLKATISLSLLQTSLLIVQFKRTHL